MHKLFRGVIFYFGTFLACINVNAQQYSFQKVDGCVNFNPFGQKKDCRPDFHEVIYPKGALYYFVGRFGLDTPYKKFSELCDSSKKVISIRNIDFICMDRNNRWISAVSYGKNDDLKIIYVSSIAHYTCSNMNDREIFERLAQAFGEPPGFRGRQDNFKGFEINNGYQHVKAYQSFQSDANSILNCPGEAILEIKIEIPIIPTIKGRKYGLEAIYGDFKEIANNKALAKNVKL